MKEVASRQGQVQYDFICSLGEDCACAMYLQGTGLRTASGPFDWLTGADFRARAGLVASGFAGFMDKGDFRAVERGTGAAHDPNCDAYVNDRTGLVYLHDFPAGAALDESFGRVAEKYRRRVERFEERLRSGGRILLVWLSRKFPMSDETVLAGCAEIRGRYGKNIDFLFIENDSGMASRRHEERMVGEKIRRIKLDMSGFHPIMGDVGHIASLFLRHDLTPAGKALSDRELDRAFLLRMAGKEERRRRRDKFKKMLFAPAKSAVSLFRVLSARFRRRRYANVLMLGYNCELAFRAVRSWGGIDSGLFNWSACVSLDGLTAALEAFDDIGLEGWYPFRINNPLHRCKASKVLFHGRAKPEELAPCGNPDERAIAADRKELESRLAYLKEKFLRQLRDEKPTLVMYKAWTRDCKPGITEKIVALKRQLEAMGGRNFELLVVCESSSLAAFGSRSPEFMLRSVREYNPNDDVTARKLGDPSGWRVLFAEFTPETIKGKGKSFKFDHR